MQCEPARSDLQRRKKGAGKGSNAASYRYPSMALGIESAYKTTFHLVCILEVFLLVLPSLVALQNLKYLGITARPAKTATFFV
jgi:hypothetical protein